MVKSFVCICIHCMDKRVNSDAAHGLEVFKMTNAGASFPAPTLEAIGAQQNTQEDSLHILLERAKESHQTVISAFSGHEDCVAVRSIWNVGEKPATERSARDNARYTPYAQIVAHIQTLRGLDEAEKIRLLTQAKTLQDINHAFAYDDIQAIVRENELDILAYFEDVTAQPHTLLLYDPRTQIFAPTQLRMKEFSENPELLDDYIFKGAVDTRSFIDKNAQLLLAQRYARALEILTQGDEAEVEPMQRAI